ncbi:hypothetical protein F5I97DRAFT_225988 [Phlebopus sp. FC_14]|nr:hypothetical protein F5I97DRAFT_225988 [Phlebopus sp. FC_14]
MVHNATLIVDGIEDDPELRGVNQVYSSVLSDSRLARVCASDSFSLGRPQSIWCPSDHKLCELCILRCSPRAVILAVISCEEVLGRSPLERLIRLENLDIIWNEELINLHRGQGLDVIWRNSFHCPTEEECTCHHKFDRQA